MKKDEYIRLKKTVSIADVRSGFNILDLGCGSMQIKNFLPKNIKYFGVDLEPLVKNTIKHDLELGLPDKIKKIRFDVIFMGEIMEHIENFKTLMMECKKILKGDGKIILSTPSNYRFVIREHPQHIHCFRKTNIMNLARICKLEITKIMGTFIPIPLLHWHIPSNQTFYTNSIIYRLEHKNDK